MAKFILIVLVFFTLLNISCKKERSCEGCKENNKPPIAVAGPDQVITLPTDSIFLDGRNSSDPDGTISEWLWTKISGPASFAINNSSVSNTIVKNLVAGVYQFELRVTDNEGSSARDTMHVTVKISDTPLSSTCPPANRPIIDVQLIPFGYLSLARTGIATVSSGNKIFFAGGYNASGPVSRVDIYDIPTQTWSTAELSLPRTRITAIACQDKVFFAGGGYSSDPTTRVDIYDLTTQIWSTAELSQGRNVQGRDVMAAAVIGNKIFFAGGYTKVFNQTLPTSRIDIYDNATQTWSTAELSEARGGITAVSTENKIYFAGGDDGNGAGLPSNKIDIYNNSTATWSISTFNEPKTFFAGNYKNGKMYWAGGTHNLAIDCCEAWTCRVETRDNNGQIIDSANLHQRNAYIRGFEKDNRILYLQDFSPLVYFDIHDLTSNTWSIGVLNQPGIYSTGNILSHNNIIYAAGGSMDNGGAGGIYTNKVYKLEF